nr:hypothetical protein [Tanacetum cinerariifolium]
MVHTSYFDQIEYFKNFSNVVNHIFFNPSTTFSFSFSSEKRLLCVWYREYDLHTENSFLSLLFVVSEKDWIRRIELGQYGVLGYFPWKSDQVEKYVGRFPDMIQGSVMASKPKTMQEAINFANELMDQKVCTFTERQADNKRNIDDNIRNNQAQQQPFKRKNVVKAYTAGPSEKKTYGGTLPLCTKCNYHHTRPCTAKCTNCKIIGHLARDCRIPAAADTQRAPMAVQRVVTCYECGIQGHYNKDCPKLKKKRKNQYGNGKAHGRGYTLGGKKANSDSNFVMGTFLLNNHYTFILFDTGADRSFVYTAFSSLIDIIPSTLDHDFHAKDKSKDKRLEDVPIVRDFPRVFPDDILGYAIWFDECTGSICGSHESGLAGYYQRLIEGFLKIAKSMTKLTQKGVKFDWGDKEEAAFQLLKQKLCSAPILALPEGAENLSFIAMPHIKD